MRNVPITNSTTNLRCDTRLPESGYSLTELLLVIAILALIATVAAPGRTADTEASLARAANGVAAAIRFARAEAIRTGEPHGVNASTFGQWIKVYRLDTSVNPAVVVYDVYEPLTKQLYDLRFGTGTTNAVISSATFTFVGFMFPVAMTGFSATTGVPKYNDFGTVRMLNTGSITLSQGGLSTTISVAPMTGRVTIQ